MFTVRGSLKKHMTISQHSRTTWQTAASFHSLFGVCFYVDLMSWTLFSFIFNVILCFMLTVQIRATSDWSLLSSRFSSSPPLMTVVTGRWGDPMQSLHLSGCFKSCSFYSLARLFSRFSMSALPSSPLLPRALHSRNSTFMGRWLNSKSLPFLPRCRLPPTEPSWELRAAERVTRKVFLWKHDSVEASPSACCSVSQKDFFSWITTQLICSKSWRITLMISVQACYTLGLGCFRDRNES